MITLGPIATPIFSPNLGPLKMVIKTFLVTFKIFKTFYDLKFDQSEVKTF